MNEQGWLIDPTPDRVYVVIEREGPKTGHFGSPPGPQNDPFLTPDPGSKKGGRKNVFFSCTEGS